MANKSNSEDLTEQINEAVEDGGGCVEAWEGLSEVRESISRRKVLKGIGAAGISTGALAGNAAASEAQSDQLIRPATDSEIDRIFADSKTEHLLDDIGSISIHSDETKRVKTSSASDIITYLTPTPAGSLFYGVHGDKTEAGIAFGFSLQHPFEPLSQTVRKQLADKFAALPPTPSTYVIDHKGRAVQSRYGTEHENNRITTQLDGTEILSFFSSDRDNIIAFETSSNGVHYLSPMPENAPYRAMTDDELTALSKATGYRIQNKCDQLLGDCAANVGASAACIAGCVTAGVATFGAAFALCAICTAGFSFNAGIECGTWYKKCV